MRPIHVYYVKRWTETTVTYAYRTTKKVKELWFYRKLVRQDSAFYIKIMYIKIMYIKIT
jgi:hypothetical protein